MSLLVLTELVFKLHRVPSELDVNEYQQKSLHQVAASQTMGLK